jgi:hypothetical protein
MTNTSGAPEGSPGRSSGASGAGQSVGPASNPDSSTPGDAGGFFVPGRGVPAAKALLLGFLDWVGALDQDTMRDEDFWTNERLVDRFILETGHQG